MDGSSPAHRPSTFQLRRRTPGTFLLVPFLKQSRSIRCQGQLEAATAQILAACPRVQNIEEQPLSIWYAWRDDSDEITLLNAPPTKACRKLLRCSYIVPDFLVTMQCGRRRLIEVKPADKLLRPLVKRKLTVATRFAEQHGWTFHTVTERQLFSGSLLANIRLLGRYRRMEVETTLSAQIEAIIRGQPVALGNLLPLGHTDALLWKAAALHLIAVGRLAVDLLVAPISAYTLLFPGGTQTWDPFDSVWGPSGSATNGSFAFSANSVPGYSLPKT
ncbi:MAG: hypothetical protein C0483_10405 [Pirellula sp.]|nr:hypothetical protein [Pirellula sp.]